MPHTMDSRSGVPTQPAVPAQPGYQGAWRFTMAPAEPSVPQVRHAVRDLIRRQQAPVSEDVMQALLLILSELVTNGIRHAALLTPEIGVEVTLRNGWVRLAVEDGHPYRPKALEADPDQQHTGGRGLLLVKTLTLEAGGECGVAPTATGGKIIWAAMPVA